MLRTSSALLLLITACGSPSGTTSTATSANDAGTGGHGGASSTGNGGQGGAVGACTTCGDACVDTANDAANCGACGHACPPSQHCDHGVCGAPACLVMGLICPGDHLCCGEECCPSWKMCCHIPGSEAPTCVSVDAGACPTICTACP